jgi:hypothetical protein
MVGLRSTALPPYVAGKKSVVATRKPMNSAVPVPVKVRPDECTVCSGTASIKKKYKKYEKYD